jgi:hypothetical protein
MTESSIVLLLFISPKSDETSQKSNRSFPVPFELLEKVGEGLGYSGRLSKLIPAVLAQDSPAKSMFHSGSCTLISESPFRLPKYANLSPRFQW